MQQLLMIDGSASEMQRDSPDAIVGHASGTKLLRPSYDPAAVQASHAQGQHHTSMWVRPGVRLGVTPQSRMSSMQKR